MREFWFEGTVDPSWAVPKRVKIGELDDDNAFAFCEALPEMVRPMRWFTLLSEGVAEKKTGRIVDSNGAQLSYDDFKRMVRESMARPMRQGDDLRVVHDASGAFVVIPDRSYSKPKHKVASVQSIGPNGNEWHAWVVGTEGERHVGATRAEAIQKALDGVQQKAVTA